MKKFEFELEQVLEFRKFEQEQAEMELGKALAVEAEINNNLQILAAQYVNAKNSVNSSRDFNDLIGLERYGNLIEAQKEALLQQLTEAKIVTEQKRAVVAECMKKTTALEKMKESEKENYWQEVRSEEKRKLNELVNLKRPEKAE